MSGILFINISLVVLFVLVFAYFYIKENELQKRLLRYEKSLDDVNKGLFNVQKFLKDNGVSNVGNSDDISVTIKQEIDHAVNDIYSIIEKDREYVDNKLAILEDKIKDSNYFVNSASGIDDRRIISMYKDGWSVDAIARELRISKSEVEFTLKLANTK